MPHFKTAFPSRFLNASEITGPYDATIAAVSLENVGTEDKPERKLVATFDEPDRKPIVLNQTRCEAVAEIADNADYTFWSGIKVTVSKGTTRFNGKKTACIDLGPPATAEKSRKVKPSRGAKSTPETPEEVPF